MMLAWMLLATVPFASPVLRDRVAVCERNHVYDCDGKKTFTQMLFIDADGSIVAWRLDHGEFSVIEDPPQVIWVEEKRVRHVTGGSWRETHLQWDKELEAREVLPKEKRRLLSGEKR